MFKPVEQSLSYFSFPGQLWEGEQGSKDRNVHVLRKFRPSYRAALVF